MTPTKILSHLFIIFTVTSCGSSDCDNFIDTLGEKILNNKCTSTSSTSSSSSSQSPSGNTTPFLIHFGGVTTIDSGTNAGNDSCNDVVVDSSQNSYCVGNTTSGMSEGNGGGQDAFIMKLDPSGNVLWHTQFGATTSTGGDSSGNESCLGVDVDSAGNVYCAGWTEGNLGETNGGDKDAFIVKLNSSGALQWITQIGDTTNGGGDASGDDRCKRVSVDSSGNVYCAGQTSGALGEANGGSNDAFILKLNSSGVLQWITQVGSTTVGGGDASGSDICHGVALDSAGDVYCAGQTSGALGEANGSGSSIDAFFLKLNSSGALQWITQIGSTTNGGGDASGNDSCQDLTIDSSDNLYCGGNSTGSLGETNGGSNDIIVIKINSSGTLQNIIQIGDTTNGGGDTSGNDTCNAISVDTSSNIYCAGSTLGALGETHGGGLFDAFVLKLDSSLSFSWLTHFGNITVINSNAGAEIIYGVDVDSYGNVYAGAQINSSSSMGEANGGGNDAVVLKLTSSGSIN